MRQNPIEFVDIRDDGNIKRFVEDWEEILSGYKSKGRMETEQCHKFWIKLDELFTGEFDPKRDLDFEKLTAIAGTAPSKGEADVYSPRYHFLAEQKSNEIDLDKPEKRQGKVVTPFQQAIGYLERFSYAEQASVRTLVTSNFREFRFYPLGENGRFSENDYVSCTLEEMPEKADLFRKLFSGEEVRKQFSILAPEYTEQAANEVSSLYALLTESVESDSELSQEEKEKYEEKIPLIVMRIVFLLFADNTSGDLGKLFTGHQFRIFLEKTTDDKHLKQDLLELFKCLNIEGDKKRASMLIPSELRSFPYVDGGIFEETISFPNFSAEVYEKLVSLSEKFNNWDGINVSVFGWIMDQAFTKDIRRKNGMFFTSKANIEKVINPLFMDKLKAEFGEIKEAKDHKDRQEKLKAFHDKLSRFQFFDPACGSGNFLTETYMELRALEDDVIGIENSSIHDLDKEIKVSLSQFHGIELDKYAVTVARTALQIAREQALEKSYARFQDTVSTPPSFLPLKEEKEAGGIVCGNALTMDWNNLVTPSEDLFIFGNPPFSGDYNKGAEQQKEMDGVFDPYPAGKLDYCAAWYYKASVFLNGSGAKFAFVSTNSITQGVQVEGLFKPIFELGWRISFAWPSVLWDHRKDAAVYVVIIGFTQEESEAPKIFKLIEDEEFDWKNGTGFEVAEVKNISPNNLKALPTVFVKKSSKPISELPCSMYGNKFADGGGLVLKSKLDRVEAEKDDRARKYIRKYIGAEELIHDKDRWCLWLANSTPEDRMHSKFLKERLEIVKKARENGQWKDDPAWLPVGGHQPDSSYLAVPKVFSERRQYATAGIEPEDVIASDELYLFLDPTGFAFSVIESSMFMAWQSLVGGRLKEDYRFSNTLVWNTFPLPSVTKDQKDLIIEGGRKVLEARANYPSSSLADLYDPGNMPSDLRKAHQSLDKAMDRIFSNKPFKSKEERQKALLEVYQKMTEKI